MSGLALVLHQFRYDQRIFWRNPPSVFFTVMLPVIFLVIFAAIFGNDTLHQLGGIKVTTYYVPGFVTLAVISATLVNLAINLTVLREMGILKRVRGTPLPAWAFIVGKVGNAIVIALTMLVVITAFGAVIYGVEIPWARLPAVLVTL